MAEQSFSNPDADTVLFHDTGHRYRRRTQGRGHPAITLESDGALLHAERVDLFDSRARRNFAGQVNGRAPAGAVEAELLLLTTVWQPVPIITPEPDREKLSEQAGDRGDDEEPRGPRLSQSTRLVELATGILKLDLFHTPEGIAYATFPVDSHSETWSLNSLSFRQYLARQFYLEEGTVLSSQAQHDALAVLSGRALFEGAEVAVATRVGEYNGRLYLDLNDREWRAVEIGPDGWRVIERPPVRFRRARGMLAHPLPVAGGYIADLRRFLHVASDDDFLLILAWLVQAFRSTGPYPELALEGEQGSAKSTAARVLKMLVDPSAAPLRAEPREPRDLMIAATNSWVIALDNLSHLSVWLSDGLCRLATGGGYATRALYSDDEEKIFEAMRPVILTGIDDIVVRADLLDRAIIVRLPQFAGERKPEKQLWQDFAVAHPALLGVLLSAVCEAMRNLQGLRLEHLPRMADFALWAAAAAPALGSTAQHFIDVCTLNTNNANDLPLEASPVVAPLRAFADEELKARSSWRGTVSELLVRLRGLADDSALRQRAWPADGRMLSNALRRIAPNLRRTGIELEFDLREPKSKRRQLEIRRGGDFIGTTVTTVSNGAQSPVGASGSSESALLLAEHTGKHGEAQGGSLVAGHTTEDDRNDGDDGNGSLRHSSDLEPTGPCEACGDRATAVSRSGVALCYRHSDEPPSTLVADATTLQAVIRLLKCAGTLGLDTETTGLDPHADRLRLIQLATPEHVYVVDCFAVDPRSLAPLFAHGSRLIGHNLAFDLRFLLANGLPIPDGDHLFDTMHASQLLASGTPEPRGTHTLAGVTERHLGVRIDKTEQHADWSGPLSASQLRYAAIDAAILLPLATVLEHALREAGLARAAIIEMRAVPAIAWLEHSGAPFDGEQWSTLSDAAVAEQLQLERELTALTSTTSASGGSAVNLGSPNQVAKLLRQRGHNVERTDEATLQSLVAVEPLARLLLDYREARRKADAYGIAFLRHVHERTGRIHAGFKQIGAASGRMSCSRPSLQNIPREPTYRACFRPAAGRVLVKADYSQIELRIAAQVSRDPALLAAYREGADVHLRTAAAVLIVPELTVTKEQRQLAKALNFGLLYGMGAPRLRVYAATNYGVQLSEQDAATFRERFFHTYPGLRRWQRRQREGSVETRTLAGRRRLGVEQFTQKLNLPIQGTGADILKLALARLWEDRATQPSTLPVLCVHDEIVLECDADHAEGVAAWLKRHMEAAGAALLSDVPVVADVSIAGDWSGAPASNQPWSTPA